MDKFCVVPWYNREIDFTTGKESVCCWIEDRIDRLSLQEKFLSGKNPCECRKCWRSEDYGIESRRQMENRFLDFKMDRDIGLIEQDAIAGIAEANTYQFFLGSTCNSTCVTCSPSASSAWRSLLEKNISIRPENQKVDRYFKEYESSINWTAAKRFNLLGGEPLLIRRSFDILQKLLDVGNIDCRISFVTNGSIVLTDSQIELVRHFTDISCCVSIDGIEQTFEYIRYPLTWSRLKDNLLLYRDIFSEIVVSFTVSNLNYHARDHIIAWFNRMELRYIENYVTTPKWFSYDVEPSHPLWSRFCQEIQQQDQLKGISIGDYIPEIYEKIRGHC